MRREKGQQKHAGMLPRPPPEGLGGQQQVEGEATGPASAAMEVVVDGGAADFEREAQGAPEPGNKPFFIYLNISRNKGHF